MNDKIKQIMSSTFDVALESITNASSSETIERWDSLNHMNLVVALEEEFNIRFNDEEIGEMLNFELIAYIINQKLS